MIQNTTDKNTTGNKSKVLIPVDFSSKNALSLKVGFELAQRLGIEVDLLHASVIAGPMIEPQFPDDFNGIDNESGELEEIELNQEVHEIDERSMEELRKKLVSQQKNAQLPDIAFDTTISPGMPEEVIAEYCALSRPAVIVMATRGKEKRREELIGSVTAEVIDHCLAPVFTVPEHYSFESFKDIIRICAFCYFEEADEEALAKLMEMFDNPSVKIFLFPATDKVKGEQLISKLNALRDTLASKFPSSEFQVANFSGKGNLRNEAEDFFVAEEIQMILAPNKKRNPIVRFFNPGLAHKILYEIDFPMLAIPV